MSSAIGAGIGGLLGSIVGSLLITPRADGSILVSIQPLKFLYAKRLEVDTTPRQFLDEGAKAVLIKADGGDVRIGDSGLSDQNSFKLASGEMVSFNISNPRDIFIRAETGTAKVYVIVLGG